MAAEVPELTTSDAELIESARSGDTRAFGELWRRHFRSAARVARQFTSIDADDLVSEAYVRIYQRVLAGGGPTGAFRPYLYTTIRNLASTWGAASKDVQVDLIEDYEDDRIPDDPAAWALDRTLTARAFRTLPDRWQTVLWYTEVEGMDPHEVAPLMGMSANGVAALSYRAREGLRKAWLQAHISDAGASGECQWTMSKMGEHARDALSQRDAKRMTDHLEDCTKCSIVSEEVDEVGSHLAMVMIPLLLGGVVGGTLLSTLAAPSAATAAELAIPAVPQAIELLAGGGAAAAPVVAGALAGGAATSVGAGAVVGGLALAAALGGTLVVAAPEAQPAVAPVAVEAPAASDDSSPTTPPETLIDPSAVPGVDPAEAGGIAVDGSVPTPAPGVGGVVGAVGGAVGGVVGGVGGVVSGTVQDVASVVAAPVTVGITLTGSGTPGGVVSLQAGGTVYASTTIGANGTYSISAGGIPQAVSGLRLVQTVDQSLLGGVLGTVGNLLKPLTISSNSSGLPVVAVG